MKDFLAIVGMVVLTVLLITGLGFLFAFPTKWLINILFTPAVLTSVGVAKISVWQAWGVNILAGLLFKNTSTNDKK